MASNKTVRLDAVAIEVTVLVDSIGWLLYERAEAADVSIDLACEPGWVSAVTRELEDALCCLVSNAIDATPRGGRVVIASHVDENGDHVLAIRDTRTPAATMWLPSMERDSRMPRTR